MEASARETFRAMEVSNAIACSVATIVFVVGAFTTKHQCSVAAPSAELAFGALKGALDGGLDIPHSEKRFVGFSKDSKQLDAKVHMKYIYGGHVAAYMRILMDDESEKYQTHFSGYVKRGIEADNIEELYKKAHAAIRADPAPKKSDKLVPTEHKRYNLKKLTYEERKAKLIERLNALNSAGASDDSEDDDRVH